MLSLFAIFAVWNHGFPADFIVYDVMGKHSRITFLSGAIALLCVTACGGGISRRVSFDYDGTVKCLDLRTKELEDLGSVEELIAPVDDSCEFKVKDSTLSLTFRVRVADVYPFPDAKTSVASNAFTNYIDDESDAESFLSALFGLWDSDNEKNFAMELDNPEVLDAMACSRVGSKHSLSFSKRFSSEEECVAMLDAITSCSVRLYVFFTLPAGEDESVTEYADTAEVF